MYRATTRGIEVQVTPRFLSDRSSPENGYYFWAYTIEITNRGPATVQLKTRHWRITDAHGKLQEVRGAGVVGETPTLEPGESFEYTSGVPSRKSRPLMSPYLGHPADSPYRNCDRCAGFSNIELPHPRGV